MSLPPGFLDELRDRLTLSAVVGRKVVWDRRKTNAAKGDFWAPCPFHHEKTPSFHVDDRKGFYYCFGCHAKGDAITFVKDTENVPFIEAVEMLAREAGMAMPEQRHDPAAAERQDRLARLADVMEEAVQLFGLGFRSAAGQPARDYAAGRGMTAETLKRFEIGYAPDSRSHLTGAFRQKGMLDEAVDAGLLIRPEDGGAPYDRFRGRLMFPIRDARGRCVAFGGRALAPNAQAKYLNSPETALFHKGRILYNIGPAREAAGRGAALVVAEGYMDVIALAAAGFEAAVAPLGTAITEEQLQLLWKLAAEPVIALDGDQAGIRAAERLIDLALPQVAPGRSLRFCVLPEGRDPDELIRAEGPSAMRRAIEASRPLVDMLWQREASAGPLDTPEHWAGLDQRLKAALARIGDVSVRNHYDAALRARRNELLRARGPAGAFSRGPERDRFAVKGGRGRIKPARPMAATKQSDLARTGVRGAVAEARIREAGILLIACHNLGALGPVEHALEEMTVRTAEFVPLREAVLAAMAGDTDLAAAARSRGAADPFDLLTRVPQARAHPLARPGQPASRVAEVLAEAIALHQAALAHEVEITEARRDLDAAEGEDWTWRVRQAGHQLQEAARLATAAAPSEQEETVSEIQRMLDNPAYKAKKR